MERKDYYKIGILMFLPVLIFFPVLNSTYFYTDEIVQIWLYRKNTSFAMDVGQGRILTDMLYRLMFSNIDIIAQLTRLRLFALITGIVSIPVWYVVFFRVSKDEGLPEQLPFFVVLFLVCSLPFGISIQWASCMELVYAYTFGLLSGYFVYRHGTRGWAPALIFGIISLSFYQNGFGCFLLPWFLQLIARQKVDRKMLAPLVVYFVIYVVYFLLFVVVAKTVFHTGVSQRAALATNPIAKGYLLLMKALQTSFHFNLVIQEDGLVVRSVYLVALAGILWLNYRSGIKRNYWQYVLVLFGAFALIYLPSMIIKENYASNRTLLGLDIAVFVWVYLTLVRKIKGSALFAAAGFLLVVVAAYNLRSVFVRPAVDEYTTLKNFIDKNYRPEISTVDYIRSPEDLVRRKYGVGTSWDEYGLSSSFFDWVPDAVTRQLVFEKTGNRALAEKLIIRNWVRPGDYKAAAPQGGPGNLLIDAPAILMAGGKDVGSGDRPK